MDALACPSIHANPTVEPEALKGREVLSGAMWGWTTETSTHALRLVVAGFSNVIRVPN
jgi:hypothetical protein